MNFIKEDMIKNTGMNDAGKRMSPCIKERMDFAKEGRMKDTGMNDARKRKFWDENLVYSQGGKHAPKKQTLLRLAENSLRGN